MFTTASNLMTADYESARWDSHLTEFVYFGCIFAFVSLFVGLKTLSLPGMTFFRFLPKVDSQYFPLFSVVCRFRDLYQHEALPRPVNSFLAHSNGYVGTPTDINATFDAISL